MTTYMDELGGKAKAVVPVLTQLGTAEKNAILKQLADDLLIDSSAILQENTKDVVAASQNGISEVMVDRLRLDESRLAAMATGLQDVAGLPDPIGQVVRGYTNLDGLNIVQNNGETAGQTVPHFHLHVIPRYQGDRQNILWKPGKASDAELDEIVNQMK
jgi:gamma-glutamyl phosphate reductase